MKKVLIIIFAIVSGIEAFAQKLTREDLLDNWTVSNKDSSYYLSEVVELHQDANYTYIHGTESCDLVEWRVEKDKFSLVDMYICSELGIETVPEQDAIHLGNERNKQILEISRKDQVVDKFEIIEMIETKVNRYPHNTRLLRLKRIVKK